MAADLRQITIRHATHYVYEQPIRGSLHYIHLCPRTSDSQFLRSFRLTISPTVFCTEYDDVYGNRTARFDVPGPFQELSIVAESSVAGVTSPHRASFAMALTPEGATLFEALHAAGRGKPTPALARLAAALRGALVA